MRETEKVAIVATQITQLPQPVADNQRMHDQDTIRTMRDSARSLRANADRVASAIVVGVPLVNLFVAGYLFVSALIAVSSGNALSIDVGWAIAISATSGLVLAVALFWLAARLRKSERARPAQKKRARRALAMPVLKQAAPEVTEIVRPRRAA